jgi:hypothetical protein
MMTKVLYAFLMNLSKLPVVVVGWVLIAPMWFLRKRPISTMPKLLMPWVNPEDWTGGYRDFPPEYACVPHDMYDGKHGFWQFYKYHAWRNGGDGLRNYEWHLCRYKVGAMKVKYYKHGYRVHQGKYGSWYFRYKGWAIKFGFRQMPIDAMRQDPDPHSIRWMHGAGPAWSIRKRG